MRRLPMKPAPTTDRHRRDARTATRPCPRTSALASTSSRARRRTSPSTSSTTSTRRPSRRPRSSRAAPTPPRAPSSASRRRSGSRASPSSSRPRATSTAAGRPASTEALGAAAPLFSLDHTEFEAALAADHVNVEDTAHKLSRSDVEAAIDAIVSAEKVLIAGTDQMAFFASYLRHLLMLLDLRAEIVASPSQEALGRLSRIDEQTLVIGLSAGRPHPLITRTMKLARHRKAPTLAITDATLSEVARLARIRLYYSSNTPAFVRSHTALLSLIQALAYGVYARDAQQYDVRIKAFRLK